MLGIGTYRLKEEEVDNIITSIFDLERSNNNQIVDHKYQIVDTASLYNNERAVVNALTRANDLRRNIIVVTKLHPVRQQMNNQTLSETVEKFKEIGWIDCLLIHLPRPSLFLQDWEFLVKNQPPSVCEIGVSNFSLEQLEGVHKIAKPFCNQIELSPFCTRTPIIDYQNQHEIITMAHSPLAKGLKFDDPSLAKMCAKYQCFPASLLINWAIQSGFWVLPRTSNVQHLNENAKKIQIETNDCQQMALWDIHFRTHPQY